MDIGALIQMLALKFPIVLTIASLLGVLVVAGQAVVSLTPGKGDDAFLEKLKAMPIIGGIFSALEKFAPFQKK